MSYWTIETLNSLTILAVDSSTWWRASDKHFTHLLRGINQPTSNNLSTNGHPRVRAKPSNVQHFENNVSKFKTLHGNCLQLPLQRRMICLGPPTLALKAMIPSVKSSLKRKMIPGVRSQWLAEQNPSALSSSTSLKAPGRFLQNLLKYVVSLRNQNEVNKASPLE